MGERNASGRAVPGQESAFPAERVPWTVAEGVALFFSFILIHVGFSALGGVVGPLGGTPAFTLGGASVAILLVIHVFLRARSGSSAAGARTIGLRAPKSVEAVFHALGPLLVGVVALLAGLVALNGFLRFFDVRVPEQPLVARLRDLARQGSHLRLAVLGFLAVIVVPVTEELTFRGLLYLPLRFRLGPVCAALIVSALFVTVHSHLAGVCHLFILALVFTELMEVTGTLLAPILAHAVHNGCMIGLIVISSGRL